MKFDSRLTVVAAALALPLDDDGGRDEADDDNDATHPGCAA